MYIDEFKDGYSKRPVFIDISDIKEINSDELMFKTNLEQYAKFLASNGDLIAYSRDETTVKLHLRSTLIQSMKIFKIISQFKKTLQIIKKKDLTTISINFKENEMSFHLNKEDYELLGNLTYEKISLRVLEQFKTSIKEYLAGNYDIALATVNPILNIN